ncbi:MAG: winged helix-turn-helix transcriptional regulator [Kiritimatiellae bacterium]|nr:winged helix-turn-helix transcriptional regulator [Kiritimatiellia bacterium]
MPETMYRASRCCRALGNPTAYLILRLLDTRRMTPSEMSQALHVSLPTISVTLRHLRNLDLVRYETRGITKEYWVKDAKVLTVLSTLEALVGTMREKRA